MEKSTKKKIVIGITILAIASVIGYAIYDSNKKKKAAKKAKEDDSSTLLNSGSSYTPSSSTGSGSSSTSSAFPLNNTASIKKFQEWVLNVKKDSSIGVADGIAGNLTKAAWAKYGAEYTGQTTTPASNTSAFEETKKYYDNIAYIEENVLRFVFNPSEKEAIKKYIRSKPHDFNFVNLWAAALKTGTPIFSYSGKIYETKDGKPRVDGW